MSSQRKVWLTSMCGPGNYDNIREMVEPITEWLDGIVWALNDCPVNDPGAAYLESVKGEGRTIRRFWPAGRHWVPMNDTLYTGLIQEGDLVLWADVMELPRPQFVSRIATEIGPMMDEADLDVLFYYGKAFLMRYRETLEYRNTPHWSLHGWNGRALEWSKVEPDESKVRLNTRPQKRTDPQGFALHYARYYVSCPAGSNTCALGIEQYAAPNEDHNAAFQRREALRLAFREEMRRRGLPLTLDGLKAALTDMDETIRGYATKEKVLSDVWHYWFGQRDTLKDTHRPQDALPIL